jgi:cytochrome P450
MTIMLAGHETTANSLSWTLYLLSLHPGVRRRLEAELDSVLGDRPPNAQDYGRLIYTRQVLQESLRLYPPAWFIGRRAREADEILGYPIPADSMVFVSPWLTHRLPDVWPNPEGFDPDRFDGAKAPGSSTFRYFPFGGGPRVCIGKGFAMMESVLVLATLLRRVRADMVQGWPVELEPVVTLRPRFGLGMTVTSRGGQ